MVIEQLGRNCHLNNALDVQEVKLSILDTT